MISLFLKVKPEDRLLFEKTFGVAFDYYFDGLSGFDIIKLDDNVIKSPDGVSMSDTILKNYGQEAVDLINRLNRIS